MKIKKGFTLVELLAVFVMLSLIFAISIPTISSVRDNYDKKVFTSDVNNFVEIAKLEHNELKENSNSNEAYYEFENGKQKDTENNGEIHFKGQTPSDGYILVTSKGKVELELVSNNRKWCASKGVEDKRPTIEKCNADLDFIVSTTKTTESITVIAYPKTLYQYNFEISYNGTVLDQKENLGNVVTFSGLDFAKEYKIKITGIRNGVSKEIYKYVTLSNFDIPKFITVPNDFSDTNGYATSVKVTIDYNQENKDENTDYSKLIYQYIYSNSLEGLEEKKNSNSWNICSSSDFKCTLEEFTSDVYIFARKTDEHNETIASNSIQFTKFDTEKPTAPVITGGSSTWTSTSRTISVQTKSTAKSGIKKYQYYISTSKSELQGGNWIDCTTSTDSQKFSSNGEYYIFFRSQSNIGNYSDPSNVQTVRVDNVTPSVVLTATKVSSGTTMETNTWSNEGLKFKLDVKTSGISGYTIYYCVKNDNTCTPSKSVSSGADITSQTATEGIYYFRYYIKSGAGVSSAIKYFKAKVDMTKPTAPIITGGSDNWINGTRTIKVKTKSQALSGIKKYQYYISTSKNGRQGGSWTDCTTEDLSMIVKTEGIRYIYYKAINTLGISGEVSEYEITKIDTVSPTKPTIKNPLKTTNSEGTTVYNWTNSDFSLTVSSSDDTSGINYYAYSYDPDGTWTKYSDSSGNSFKTTPFSTPRDQSVYIKACDKAGNCSANASTRIRIDKTPPTITWSTEKGTVVVNTTISISCKDLHTDSTPPSGPASSKICDSNGCGTTDATYAQVIPGSANPSWSLTGTCVDKAGNISYSPRTFAIVNSSSGSSSSTKTCYSVYYGGYTPVECTKKGGKMTDGPNCPGSYSTCCEVQKCN